VKKPKTGVLPGNLTGILREISVLENVKIMGLMTMGPRFGDPEDSRPYFKKQRRYLIRQRHSL